MVHHPGHYNKGNPTYEPYRVISEWGCNFNIGSAIKYLARYKDKWDPIEDLRKAKQYIDFEIEALEESKKPVERERDGRCSEFEKKENTLKDDSDTSYDERKMLAKELFGIDGDEFDRLVRE